MELTNLATHPDRAGAHRRGAALCRPGLREGARRGRRASSRALRFGCERGSSACAASTRKACRSSAEDSSAQFRKTLPAGMRLLRDDRWIRAGQARGRRGDGRARDGRDGQGGRESPSRRPRRPTSCRVLLLRRAEVELAVGRLAPRPGRCRAVDRADSVRARHRCALGLPRPRVSRSGRALLASGPPAEARRRSRPRSSSSGPRSAPSTRRPGSPSACWPGLARASTPSRGPRTRPLSLRRVDRHDRRSAAATARWLPLFRLLRFVAFPFRFPI